MRKMVPVLIGLLGLGLSPQPALALETSLQYVLTLKGDIERHQIQYDCEGQKAPITVEYLNAAPNFLAIVPIDSQQIIFANVIAASGVRYAAGTHIWWTKGAEASLYDATAKPDAPPVLNCLEHNETP